MGISISTVAQDECVLIKRVEKQAIDIRDKNDSIQKKNNIINSLNSRIVKLKEDSALMKQNELKIKQLSIIGKEKSQLIKDTTGIFAIKKENKIIKEQNSQLQFQVKNICKDTADISRLRLENKLLESSRTELSSTKTLISKIEDEKRALTNEKRVLDALKNKCLSILVNRYEFAFEFLTQNSSIETLSNDILLIESLDEKSILIPKLKNLKLFKEAEKSLSLKYDKEQNDGAHKSLQSILTEPSVVQLDKILQGYANNTKYLKNTITTIQKENSNKADKIEALIREKKTNTIKIIEDYVYDYEVDLTKYTYLNSVITKLKLRKLEKVDADVQDLLEEL